jgi:hypothetical protein
LRNKDSEKIAGLKVGGVQWVDIGAKLRPQRAGQRMAVGDRRESVQLGLQRRDSLRLDGALIHEGRVEVSYFSRIVARRGPCFGGGFNERAQVLPRLVGQNGAGSIARFVGGNGCGVDPSSIGIRIEIITRGDGLVHSRQIDT